MKYAYCPACGRDTGHARRLGWGTFFAAVITFGLSLLLIPLYPKRCTICGREMTSSATHGANPPVPPDTLPSDTKVCPVCAETIKLAALKCRFCGHEFPSND